MDRWLQNNLNWILNIDRYWSKVFYHHQISINSPRNDRKIRKFEDRWLHLMKKQSKRTEEEQKIITTKQPHWNKEGASSIVCSASFLLSRQRRLIGVLAVQRNPDRTGTSHKIPLMSKDHETPVFSHPNRHKLHSFFSLSWKSC